MKKQTMRFCRKLIRKLRSLALLLPFLVLLSCQTQNKKEIPVAEVERGTFYLDVYEEGEIKATNFTSINVPNISWRYGTFKITELIEDGTEVQAGDTVLVLDPSEVQKEIVDSESDLEMRKAEMEKMMAQHKSTIEGLKSDLEITRISQEISRLEFESAEYEADIRKKEIELRLEKANIALDKARDQLESRIKIQEEERKQKQLDIEREKLDLKEAHDAINKLNVTAPAKGIAIIRRNWSTDIKFQVGDQCWRGSTIATLPDLSELKAEIQINEVDITKVKKGLRVEVKPDAFSDSVYQGEVIEVANLAVNKDRSSKIKVFPVDILLKTSGENLMPGLTVSCRIIVDEIEDVLFVPQEAVYSESLGDYVYLKTMTGFEKRQVKLGQSNTDFVVVLEGLKEDDEVALLNPFEEVEEKSEEL